jgi:hypothetical protein
MNEKYGRSAYAYEDLPLEEVMAAHAAAGQGKGWEARFAKQLGFTAPTAKKAIAHFKLAEPTTPAPAKKMRPKLRRFSDADYRNAAEIYKNDPDQAAPIMELDPATIATKWRSMDIPVIYTTRNTNKHGRAVWDTTTLDPAVVKAAWEAAAPDYGRMKRFQENLNITYATAQKVAVQFNLPYTPQAKRERIQKTPEELRAIYDTCDGPVVKRGRPTRPGVVSKAQQFAEKIGYSQSATYQLIKRHKLDEPAPQKPAATTQTVATAPERT